MSDNKKIDKKEHECYSSKKDKSKDESNLKIKECCSSKKDKLIDENNVETKECCSSKKDKSKDESNLKIKECCSSKKDKLIDENNVETKECCSSKKKKNKIEKSSNIFLNIIFLFIIIILFINIAFLFNFTNKLDNKLTQIIEDNKGQVGDLYLLQSKDCSECISINDIKDQITKANIEVNKEESLDVNSAKAKNLISKYSIKKLPAIIFESKDKLKSNLIKSWKKSGKQVAKGFSWETVKTPYYDVVNSRKVGIVSATIVIKQNCKDCIKSEAYIQNFKQFGVYINKPTVINFDSKEGISLIKKYSITKLPFIVFSKEISDYKKIAENWTGFGKILNNNDYILSKINPPYFDISKGKVVGLVQVTYLTDKSCLDCYNVKLHKKILGNMGLISLKEKTIDISSKQGKQLIKKYNITKVPTVILSSEAKYYEGLTGAWKQVGSIEKDGSYIFRKLEILKKKYQDLLKK